MLRHVGDFWISASNLLYDIDFFTGIGSTLEFHVAVILEGPRGTGRPKPGERAEGRREAQNALFPSFWN